MAKKARRKKQRKGGGTLRGTYPVDPLDSDRCIVDPRKKVVSIEDVKDCASSCWRAFFQSPARRTLKTKIPDIAYPDGKGGAFFITGETTPGKKDPRYTVRHFRPQPIKSRRACAVTTVGRFQEYEFQTQARNRASREAEKARER